MDEALKDERFSHILKDPRFRKIPRNVQKIKLDKRFNHMFKNRDFSDKSKFDERGRALDLTSAENLQKLYNATNDSDEDETPEIPEVTNNDKALQKKITKNKNFQDDSQGTLKQADKRRSSKKNKEKDVRFCDDEFDSNEISGEDDMHGAIKLSKKTQHLKSKAVVSPKLSRQTIKQELRKTHDIPDENESDSSEDDEFESDDAAKIKPGVRQIKVEHKKKEVSDSDEAGRVVQNDRHSQVDESSDEDESGSTDEDSEKKSNDSDSDSEDESDSSSDESISQKDEFDHHWEELQAEAEDTKEITSRLAVCNMDWDRIRADDLYVVFNSFKPTDSFVHSVKIYPSEFGLQRIEEEKLNGPPELVEKTLDSDEEEVEDKKGSRYNREKLRQYQINRLRYYYAVVECDAPETANHLYEQLNGMEYESSSVRFDLRFIPEDTTFNQEPISVVEKSPDPTEYKPRLFVTTALQQVKVNLTWDETDPQRKETLQKAFTDPDSIEKDIRDYLASSSDESEEEENELADEDRGKVSTKDRIAKYRALLQSMEEKNKKEDEKFEMEITWDPSLKEKTEKMLKEKSEDTINPFDEMLKKKKEERKLKKQQKKMNSNQEDENSSASEESDSEFLSDEKSAEQSLKKDAKRIDELYLLSDTKKKPQETKKSKGRKYKKAKQEKVDEFKCDITDPRFSAVYSSHDYNIDPSDPHFKKTDGSLAIIQEKQKRLKNKDVPITEERKTKKMRYR